MAVSITQLSDVGLVEHGDRAVGEEHSSGIRILEFLVELEKRSLHLQEGYSSLFDFCTRRWRYSPSKAGRYIAAARAMVRHPELRRLLEELQLTICGAARIASALDAGDSEELLRSVAGKTFAEIDGLVAKRRVAPRIPDRIRPVGVRPVAATPGVSNRGESFLPGTAPGAATDDVPGVTTGGGATACAPAAVCGDDSVGATVAASGAVSGDASAGAPAASSAEGGANSQHGSCEVFAESLEEIWYDIRFSASREFVEKLERAKAVCSARGDLESVLSAALDQLLERRDPGRRAARRAKRLRGKSRTDKSADQGSVGLEVLPSRSGGSDLEESNPIDPQSQARSQTQCKAQTEERLPTHARSQHQTPSQSQPQNPTLSSSRTGTNGPERGGTRASSPGRGGSRRPRSRHVPADVRDAVFARDGGCCSYIGRDGVRCGSRSYLQIDHVHPFSLGGGHEIDNLRLLCGRHNRLEGERLLGKGVMAEAGAGKESRASGVSWPS